MVWPPSTLTTKGNVMEHYLEEPFESKKALLKSVELNKDTFMRLFFQARNNTIESSMARIEKYFKERKFDVTAEWSEDSRYACIKIILNDKYKHLRYCFLERDGETGDQNMVSLCMYSVKSIQDSAYYGCRKPKKAEDFDVIMGSEEFKDFMNKTVNRCNYPFSYISHSSF